MEKIKRKSGLKYRDSITINGRTIKSPCFAKKTDCISWKAKQLATRDQTKIYGDAFRLRDKMLLKNYAADWLTSKKAQGLSTSSIENYQRYIEKHIVPALGHRDMKSITKTDLESFQGNFAKSHNPKGTNLVMTVLKALMRGAVNDGFMIRNPAEGLKKIAENPQVEAFWTKTEIAQFLRGNLRHPLYSLFIVALNTGMRRGELAGLCWDRVDFSLNQITITRTRDIDGLKERTKTKLRRFIPMNPIVRATLLHLHKHRTASHFVFLEKGGNPIEVHHLYREFAKAQKVSGITNRIPFHALRHTFASQFIMNGGDIFDLQKFLGHTDIKMTMRYAHFSPDHLHRAMDGFELGNIEEVAQNPPTVFEARDRFMENIEVINC